MLVELTCTNFTFLFSFLIILWKHVTAQKLKFSIKDFYSKCDQIRRKLRIWSHLLKKSLMKNFIFCAVCNEVWDCNLVVNLRIRKMVYMTPFQDHILLFRLYCLIESENFRYYVHLLVIIHYSWCSFL